MQLCWASWGPVHWRWFRRWALLRMGQPDLAAAVGNRVRPAAMWLARRACPLCGSTVSARVHHELLGCALTADLRQEILSAEAAPPAHTALSIDWLMSSRDRAEVLKLKVRWAGRVLGRVARALGRPEEEWGDEDEKEAGDEEEEEKGEEAEEEEGIARAHDIAADTGD